MLVRIKTTCGLEGWGEGGKYGPAEPVACVIDDILGSTIIGKEV